jgi:hypothetical protein
MSAIGMLCQSSFQGVNCREMEGNKTARFLNWISRSKLRRFAALLVFWMVFDRLFGYISHGIIGWPLRSWAHSVFYSVWMALWFTVFSVFGWQGEIEANSRSTKP